MLKLETIKNMGIQTMISRLWSLTNQYHGSSSDIVRIVNELNDRSCRAISKKVPDGEKILFMDKKLTLLEMAKEVVESKSGYISQPGESTKAYVNNTKLSRLERAIEKVEEGR